MNIFAHEVGHNLGAYHDEGEGCGKDFLMSKNQDHFSKKPFSECSISKIQAHLTSEFKKYLKDILVCIEDKVQQDQYNNVDINGLNDLKEYIEYKPICEKEGPKCLKTKPQIVKDWDFSICEQIGFDFDCQQFNSNKY